MTRRACSTRVSSQVLSLRLGFSQIALALFQSKLTTPYLAAATVSVQPERLLVWMIVDSLRRHVGGKGGASGGYAGTASGAGGGAAGGKGFQMGSGIGQCGNLHQFHLDCGSGISMTSIEKLSSILAGWPPPPTMLMVVVIVDRSTLPVDGVAPQASVRR